MSNKVYLTNEGFLEIEGELNHLKEVKRPEIIKALKSKGIKDLSVRYKGWANNGITNKGISKSADLIGVLGGKKGYQSFADYAKQNKVKVYNDVELSTFTKGKQYSFCICVRP